MKFYKIIQKKIGADDLYFEDDDNDTTLNAIVRKMQTGKGTILLENAAISASSISSIVIAENYPGVVKGEDGFYYLEGKMCDREGNVCSENEVKYFKSLENKRLN